MVAPDHVRYRVGENRVSDRLIHTGTECPCTYVPDWHEPVSSPDVVHLGIDTRNPGKWIIVDTVTHQAWHWRDGTWMTTDWPMEPMLSHVTTQHPCRGCGLLPAEHPTRQCDGWY